MPKVLVAGATGHLGKLVLREFKARGYWVRVLVRNPQRLGGDSELVDDVLAADATRPESLQGACDGVDVVFSSLGAPVTMARQSHESAYTAVDYQGNRNILGVAKAASVQKFMYVSVFGARLFDHLEYVKAHEDFVRELQASGCAYVVIRPTAFFSAMTQVLDMARSGRVFLIGDGQSKVNPIHEADLAKVCVDAATGQEREIRIGGPESYTRREIGELAFRVLGKRPRFTSVPPWLFNTLMQAVRPFNKRISALGTFGSAAMQVDVIAPAAGSHTLKRFCEECARPIS